VFLATCLSRGAVLQGVKTAVVFTKCTTRLLGIPEVSAGSAARASAVHQTAATPSGETGRHLDAYQVGYAGEKEEIVGEGAAEDVDSVETAHSL